MERNLDFTKKIGILGSTGSIGTQTLQVLRGTNAKVVALAAGRNVKLLAEQALEFQVPVLCIDRQEDAVELRKILASKNFHPEILYGAQGLAQLAGGDMDILVTAIMGMRGLIPTLAALDKGTDIALANKETLVVAGEIVMNKAKSKGVQILPVDSEHSAVFQALQGNREKEIEKIILTASGGPFRGKDRAFLENVSLKETLAHPTWKMGGKITVDCATMMNKGLEIIEAMHLFNMPQDKIDAVVHPQSIIHSMVMYRDGSVIAQMGNPDMKVPIQYALTYPSRMYNPTPRLNLAQIGQLTFEEPDEDTFVCLKLAREAAKTKGTLPVVMNGANEIAVDHFLNGRIKFNRIPYVISRVMDDHMKDFEVNPDIECILTWDEWARSKARSYLEE